MHQKIPSKNDFTVVDTYSGVLEYLERNPSGCRAADIAEATGEKTNTVRARLLRLQAEGFVRVERLPRAVVYFKA
ncbi:MAG: helix-turn-helix domain-containing protein [Halobacteriota archaeon]